MLWKAAHYLRTLSSDIAGGTCPMSAARSRRDCATDGFGVWFRRMLWNWASTLEPWMLPCWPAIREVLHRHGNVWDAQAADMGHPWPCWWPRVRRWTNTS